DVVARAQRDLRPLHLVALEAQHGAAAQQGGHQDRAAQDKPVVLHFAPTPMPINTISDAAAMTQPVASTSCARENANRNTGRDPEAENAAGSAMRSDGKPADTRATT